MDLQPAGDGFDRGRDPARPRPAAHPAQPQPGPDRGDGHRELVVLRFHPVDEPGLHGDPRPQDRPQQQVLARVVSVQQVQHLGQVRGQPPGPGLVAGRGPDQAGNATELAVEHPVDEPHVQGVDACAQDGGQAGLASAWAWLTTWYSAGRDGNFSQPGWVTRARNSGPWAARKSSSDRQRATFTNRNLASRVSACGAGCAPDIRAGPACGR